MSEYLAAAPPDLLTSDSGDQFLHTETSWRTSEALELPHAEDHITIAYWRDKAEHERKYCAPVLRAHYTIEVHLRSAIIDCFSDGRQVSKGTVNFGGTQIASPGEKIESTFRRPVEAVHIFVPHSIVASTYEDLQKSACPPEYHLADPAFGSDAVMGKLAEILVEANTEKNAFAPLFGNSLAMAALARAMAFQQGRPPGGHCRGLAPWRLMRTIEYIAEMVGERITLEDMAEHAGLSRMHFAAQFKRATGLSPHAFLQEKRLELAKTLLAEGRLPLAQVAFAVGFGSQAHFTAVFHKAVGTTPGRWRRQLSITHTNTSTQVTEEVPASK